MSGKNLTKKVTQKLHTDYPFAIMQVDDFFFVDVNDDAGRATVRAATHNYSKRNGGKFSVRQENNQKMKVTRIE